MTTRRGAKAALLAVRCPICWETMESPQVTTCGHAFCAGCITFSLSLKKECPVCRQPTQRRKLRPMEEGEKLEEMRMLEKQQEAPTPPLEQHQPKRPGKEARKKK